MSEMGPSALKAGDATYADFGRYGAIDVKAGMVLKITPTGQITVDFGETWPGNGKPRVRRFTDYGSEMNGDAWHRASLIDAEQYAARAERQRAADARQAVFAHLRTWELKNKAAMIAYARRLTELVSLVPDDESVPADS